MLNQCYCFLLLLKTLAIIVFTLQQLFIPKSLIYKWRKYLSKYFLFTIVMATIPTTSKLLASTDEENRIGYETNLSAENTDDEIHTNTSTWSIADRKKLQHMREFHQEYQCVFGEGASIQTIMKRRISHMNPPMPKAVCKEEMQSTHLDSSEVIIEYMTHAHSNRIKKLKPIFIKLEPDREHTCHIDSDDDLPAVPEEEFYPEKRVNNRLI